MKHQYTAVGARITSFKLDKSNGKIYLKREF